MKRLEHYWQSRNVLAWLLYPLSLVFIVIAALRRGLYRIGVLHTERCDVPVIVVGNITVGGTGKTPLVIWLVNHLRKQGYQPGIVSRGYGGHARSWPQQVRPDSDPHTVGDEAVVLASQAACPVCVGPDRPAAIRALCAHTDVDIVVCDDGLQHYALARDIEIVVVDGERRFGNGWRLPAGPLRESVGRLDTVDMVICNGQPAGGEFALRLRRPCLRPLLGGECRSLDSLAGRAVHAVAGIGNPQRFFAMLERFDLDVDAHPFPDHHAFTATDVQFNDTLPVLMTAKDGVKCRRFARPHHWVVEVDAQPDAAFVHRLNQTLKVLKDG